MGFFRLKTLRFDNLHPWFNCFLILFTFLLRPIISKKSTLQETNSRQIYPTATLGKSHQLL